MVAGPSHSTTSSPAKVQPPPCPDVYDLSGVDWDDDLFSKTSPKVAVEENVEVVLPKEEPVSSHATRCLSADQVLNVTSLKKDENIVKRSFSADQAMCSQPSSKSGGPSDSKRKLPEWISKPNSQAELRKKMKQNSLFKL